MFAQCIVTPPPAEPAASLPRHPNDPSALAVALQRAVAVAFGVPEQTLHMRSRGPADAAFARQCAMYLAHVVLGLNYSEAGQLFGRDRTTAAHACRLVETRRDDPDIDRLLKDIEDACGAGEPRPAGEPRI